MPTTYLVTGAGRGLGHALTRALSFQPETNIIATVRSTESLPALEALPIHQTSKIIPFLITFGAETEDLIQSAISSLRETHPWLTQIDTVIASAAISKSPGRVIETLSSDLREHLAVNAVAVAALFQATWPLLKLAPIPRFVVISSIGGSIKEVPQTSAFASVAYGMSKAALNYLIRKIGVENEDLAIMAIHPGWVQTDLGNGRAVQQGLSQAPVELADSVEGILVEINQMKRGEDYGFRTFDHKDIAW